MGIPQDLSNFDALPNSAHVGVEVIAGILGCKPSAIWARLRAGTIPKPVKFGAHTRWNVGEIRAYVDAAISSTVPLGVVRIASGKSSHGRAD